MITSELIEYIKGELNDNVSKDLIISTLLEAGWKKEDIEEGFSSIKDKENQNTKKSFDPYREMPDDGDPAALRLKIELEDKNTGTISPPTGGTQILDLSNLNNSINVPIIDTTVIKPVVKEIPPEEPVVVAPPVVETITEMTPPEIPISKFASPIIMPEKEKPIISTTLEVAPVEIPMVVPNPSEEKIEINKVWTPLTIKPVEDKKEIEDKKESIPTELIPNLNKIPSIAMLSSYSGDIINATKKEEEVVVLSPARKKNFLKLGIFIIILAFIGVMAFAFVEGYIKIPGSKFSFLVVKKDPKTLILNAASSISKLKSFKTDTSINITSPSLSNITTGLSSGDVVTSNDKDSISIKALGLTNHVNGKSVIDYKFNLKSSILDEDIETELRYNNGDLYASIPDLAPIFGKDSPDPTTISTKRDQMGSLILELPVETQNLIKKLDIYNMISMEIPLYVKNETMGIMNEFINTFEYIDKGEEIIKGVNTTHYEVTVSRPATKKFFGSLATLFVPQLSPDEKKNLDEVIGASSISSLDIWIGEKDDNLYQIKFTLNSPLSKVLRLNDSGIAGGEVTLEFMTTFYDLDIENNITIPKGEIDMGGLIKNIQNIKIKNTMASFKSQSLLFKNAVGSYGKVSNKLGSCTAPLSGSMFSPLGHSKGADTAVSSISNTMNSLLAVTKNEGFCFSSSKAWAIAVPLNTDPISYYCSDSEGKTTTLLSPITSTACISATPVVETTKVIPVLPTTPPILPATN